MEEILVTSDVGVDTTLKIIERIEARVEKDKYLNTNELNSILREEITLLLTESRSNDVSEFSVPSENKPHVIMVVGVNLLLFLGGVQLVCLEQIGIRIMILKLLQVV